MFNYVPKTWLKKLHYGYLALDVAYIGSYVLLHATHYAAHNLTHWALTPLVLSVFIIHFIYGVSIYFWVRKRNPWLAAILSQTLFDLTLLAAIQVSDHTNLLFRFLWIGVVAASTALGFYVGLAEAALNGLRNVFVIFNIVRPSPYGAFKEWLLTAAVAVAWLGGWYFFKRYYVADAPSVQSERLNRNLDQAQMQSNLIFQSITDGVIVFDVTGKIGSINPAAATLIGWKAKDAIGLDIHLVMKLARENGQPLSETSDLFMSVLEDRQHIHQTLLLTGAQDQHTVISLTISPIVVPPSDVAGAIVIFRDVTQEHQEEQQRADFISTASHEMRTPVAAIEGYLALALNDKVSRIDSKARDYLLKAHASTENLGKLFQDLLTSAKAEDGRLSSHPVVIEIGGYLQQLVDELRFAAQKKQLLLDFLIGSTDTIDASIPATATKNAERVMKPLYFVHADPDRLREVITNIFDNAVKYTEQGKVAIGLTGDNSVVQMFIRDTGPGIPADDIPHLFQKFYRVDNSVTRTTGGTGLGLFISRKIIELYRGRIWVESTLGQGSTFYINLPRLTPQKAAELQAKEAADSSKLLPINTSMGTS
jgi:two-component system, OmpR family, sensor histidine kinase VicK